MRRCSERKFSAWFSLSGLLKGFAAAAVKVGGESLAFITCEVFCTSVALPKPRRPSRWRRGSQLSTPSLSPLPPALSLHFLFTSNECIVVERGRADKRLSVPWRACGGESTSAGAKCRTSPAASQYAASTAVSQVAEQVVLISRVVQLTQQ